MDQKNTIVKCHAHPNCLFNHNGVCDNYVINIGEGGKCQCYIETEDMVDSINALGNINVALPEDIKRGLRANGNFIKDDSFNLCSAACYHYDFKGACIYCQLRQEYLSPERLMKPCNLFTKGGSGAIKMKVVEFDKPNKNKSIIGDWDYAATPDICKTCKKVVFGQDCKWKDVAYGVWTCYEGKNEV